MMENEYVSRLTDEDLWDSEVDGTEEFIEYYTDDINGHAAPMDKEFWEEVREAYDEIQA